jgi:hypothetical protein
VLTLTVQSVVGLTGRAQKVWALGTPTLTLDRALIHAGAAPGLVTMHHLTGLFQSPSVLVARDGGGQTSGHRPSTPSDAATQILANRLAG